MLNNPTIKYLKDYKAPQFLIKKVELDFLIDEDKTELTSKLHIRRNNDCPGIKETYIFLNGDDLRLVYISLNNVILDHTKYSLSSSGLRINNVPEQFTLITKVHLNPKKNTKLMGLYSSKDGLFTQCEAEGFRKITFFLDRPDILSIFKVKISANKKKYPKLLSNGNLIASGKNKNHHWVTWFDPHPKPSYLFAMVAANLEEKRGFFITKSKKKVMLSIFVEPGKINQTTFAMESLKRAMKWDEKVFDLEVDLKRYMIVAVSDFNMGAMENKGLNIFNAKYILSKADISTDSDFIFIDRVIAHEYFHNWTGNRVTCRDWFQLSLKEGLTVFRDQEYGADVYSRSVQRIKEVRSLRSIQFPEDNGPMAHPVRPTSYIEINNFYTATVYEKGAEIVRMIHTILGEKKFQKGMKLYFKRYDGCAVTTDDFIEAMQDASKIDLNLFKNWYKQIGTPVLTATDYYDSKKREYSILFTQEQKKFSPMFNDNLHIPIEIGLMYSNGKSIKINKKNSKVISLKKKKEKFTFKNIKEKPIPSLLRNFSAPINLKYKYSETELLNLSSHDVDTFNRWECCQKIFSDIILKNTKTLKKNNTYFYPKNIFETLKSIILDENLDKAFIAELFTLPSEQFLAEKMKVILPDQLHLSRNKFKRLISKNLKVEFLKIYEELNSPKSYSPDPSSSGKRALKNLCLDYLMELEEDEVTKICYKQFKESNNMTDTLSALISLCDHNFEEKQMALNDFYKKWENEETVIDKWFTIQARSKIYSTIKTVKKLTKDKLFNYRNPNKVYALIRTFGFNHHKFHATNGSGYKFLSKQILIIDKINPQVSSRLARSFDKWRNFEKDQKKLARIELEIISSKKRLSKDLHEIISKLLKRTL